MEIVFTRDHTDETGSYLAGEVCEMAPDQALPLITQGVAKARPPAGPTEYKDAEETEEDSEE